MAQSPIPIDFEGIPNYSYTVFVGTGFADDHACTHEARRYRVAIRLAVLPSDCVLLYVESVRLTANHQFARFVRNLRIQIVHTAPYFL